MTPDDESERFETDLRSARAMFERALTPPRLTGGAGEHWNAPPIEEVAALFPGFEILQLVGRGGMGAVYKARQESLDRLVAIKLLPLELSVEEDFTQRFRREAHAMAKLSHPNIVAVHDHGQTDDGHFFIVMEFVEGADLQQVIRDGALTPPQVFGIVRQICDALAYAHALGFVHRDVKPGNVLLDAGLGVAKVSDFGVARLTGETEAESLKTIAAGVVGTPAYIAPEQLKDGASADHRADIYSIGVMFYELLTGEIPRGAFAPPSARAGVDRHIDGVVEKAMRPEPERRYQSAGTMRDDIRESAGMSIRWWHWACAAMTALMITRAISPPPREGRFGGLKTGPQPPLGQIVSDPRGEYENHLGMPFVPVPGSGILVCRTETRVQDFRAFIDATRHEMSGGIYHRRGNAFTLAKDGDWQNPPDHKPEPDFPVIGVSWLDADEFCRWLTQVERTADLVPDGWEYRLLTLKEWDDANGRAHWGVAWPPPGNACNLPGEEQRDIGLTPEPFLTGWRDDFAGPCKVDQFPANVFGLFGMSGNVSEWVIEQRHRDPHQRLSAGSNWGFAHERWGDWLDYPPDVRATRIGFRVALAPVPSERELAERNTPDLDQGFFNSLDMKFVPAGTRGVLVSVTETRIAEFSKFVETTGHPMRGPVWFHDGTTGGLSENHDWQDPGYAAGPEFPVTCVSWDDARAFCDWLTESERLNGHLRGDPNWHYRLPTLEEFETAARWDDFQSNWPPDPRYANLPGEEMRAAGWRLDTIDGWRDEWQTPVPWRSVLPGHYGIRGMTGNVAEWVIGDHHAVPDKRTFAGCDWLYGDPKTHATIPVAPDSRGVRVGFRVVLANRRAGE